MLLRKVVVYTNISIAVAIVAGCTVGPDYHTPVSAVPGTFTNTTYPAEEGAVVTSNWWKTFDDPMLDSLIDRAIESNLDLQEATARIREARAAAGLSRADFFPTIDALGSYERQQHSKNGFLPIPNGISRNNDMFQTGFDASWEIDIFGGTRRAVEAADADVEAAEFSRQDIRVSLIAEVARTYVEARCYQQRLIIAKANIKTQRASHDLVSDRERQGLANGLDTTQAATILAETESRIPVLESSLASSIHRLGILLGQSPTALYEELYKETAQKEVPTAIPAGLPSDLLRRRADIRTAESRLKSSNAKIGEAIAEFFPKFSITGNIGLQSTSAGELLTGSSLISAIGPSVRWRIFDAGKIASNVQVQDARQEQALAGYRKTVLQALADVENALVACDKEQTHTKALARAVKSSQESVDISNRIYVAGMSSYINVLDAERSLYQNQDALIQSQFESAKNLIALCKALGGGWTEPEENKH